MLRTIRFCILFSILLGCLASAVFAQGGYAVVSGRVEDASSAVIPGVAVAAQNISTGVTLNSVSNDEGYYTFTNLIPGTYTITVRHSGFKDLERSGLVLQVGDRLSVDLVLEVGESSQRITVTGQASLLRTDDAQAGMVIDNHRIQELPAYDRNVLSFASLVANVNGTDEQAGQTTNFRINGGRSAQAEYYVDGFRLPPVISTTSLHRSRRWRRWRNLTW